MERGKSAYHGEHFMWSFIGWILSFLGDVFSGIFGTSGSSGQTDADGDDLSTSTSSTVSGIASAIGSALGDIGGSLLDVVGLEGDEYGSLSSILGTALLLDPDIAGDIISAYGEVEVSIMESKLEVISNALSGIGGFIKDNFLWILAGVGIWMWLRKDKD